MVCVCTICGIRFIPFATAGAAMPIIQTAQAPVLPHRRPVSALRSAIRERPLHRSAIAHCIPHIALSCLCWALASPAQSSETQFGEDAMATLLEEKPSSAVSSFEVNTSVLPSVNDPFTAGHLQRNGAAASFNATQHLDVTRWLTPEASNRFGLSLGMSAPAPSHALSAAGSANTGFSSASQLDLGVRWRSELQRGRHLDVSAWAQTPDAMTQIWQTQAPVYSTRVEVQWASSRTRGLVPEFGAIGVRLQGGSRLVLRARKGGPMLYYRARF